MEWRKTGQSPGTLDTSAVAREIDERQWGSIVDTARSAFERLRKGWKCGEGTDLETEDVVRTSGWPDAPQVPGLKKEEMCQ